MWHKILPAMCVYTMPAEFEKERMAIFAVLLSDTEVLPVQLGNSACIAKTRGQNGTFYDNTANERLEYQLQRRCSKNTMFRAYTR